ncbi:hypothetical protein NESM_000629300 [Novymonas esmeraldas]|uniref:Uncharacterized protein n=1 Tax=Novymonas esmeraldas TaxID=1808958 RepID=A0AAW0ETL2_9TRYP
MSGVGTWMRRPRSAKDGEAEAVQPMVRPTSPSSSRLVIHPIGLASMVVFLVVCLGLGYHTGASDVERQLQQRLASVAAVEATVVAERTACMAETMKLVGRDQSDKERVRGIQQAVAALTAEQQAEEDSYAALDTARQQCADSRVQAQQQQKLQNENDTRVREEVEELRGEIAALQLSISQITRGEGMSIVVLRQGLQRLRAAYTERCRHTPGCVELTDAELLQRWSGATDAEQTLQAFLQRHEDALKAMTNNSFESPAADRRDIVFRPTLAEELAAASVSKAPVYFGRSIHEKPLYGVDKKAQARFAGRAVAAVERVTDYGLCAYRHRLPNFTFQSPFFYIAADTEVDEAARARTRREGYVHTLVVSPLMRFCVQCDYTTWTQYYRLACMQDRVQLHYGSHDFWAARSLVQASPAVQRAAFHFYEARDWAQKKILSVVLHQAGGSDTHHCDTLAKHRYGLHYQYLRANYPNDTALQQHISDDLAQQCAPTLEQVVAYVQKVRSQAPYPIDHVYFSISEENRVTLDSLLTVNDPTQLKPLLLPAYTNAKEEAATPGFTELVDLEIAARATDVLVSAFLPPSRYVTENFLLRNGLAPGGHVWTF